MKGGILLKTKNEQPIKSVSQQDIHSLVDLLTQLKSWTAPLKLIENYFSDESRPVNKQKLANEYYAYSKIFKAFHCDLDHIIEQSETQLNELKSRRKMEV
ncbi:hypothetical protein [Candidatus Enterococcus clewellii]|uniref:hypothetical protein n=1 Tax=Candidatus Enterococcus clewellii TaxID=1834193 RepID=UPI0030CD0CF2